MLEYYRDTFLWRPRYAWPNVAKLATKKRQQLDSGPLKDFTRTMMAEGIHRNPSKKMPSISSMRLDMFESSHVTPSDLWYPCFFECFSIFSILFITNTKMVRPVCFSSAGLPCKVRLRRYLWNVDFSKIKIFCVPSISIRYLEMAVSNCWLFMAFWDDSKHSSAPTIVHNLSIDAVLPLTFRTPPCLVIIFLIKSAISVVMFLYFRDNPTQSWERQKLPAILDI